MYNYFLFTAEREKLFDEVETEWAKRESKTLLKVQRLSSGTDGDSDSDNESEECIVKGRNVALNAFYRIARNTMSMWFRTIEPSAEEVCFIYSLDADTCLKLLFITNDVGGARILETRHLEE